MFSSSILLFAGICFSSASNPTAWMNDINRNFDDLNHFASFKNWQHYFNQSYETIDEEAHRFLLFVENWKNINDHNMENQWNYTMGMNQFSAMTNTEFLYHVHGHAHSCLNERDDAIYKAQTTPSNDSTSAQSTAPKAIDWTNINGSSYVTPVKNQKNCGSCWSFSTVGSLESFAAIKNGWTDSKIIQLSEQQLVDCTYAAGIGCQGGLQEDGFTYIHKNGGLCTESEYPYTGHDGKCKSESCGSFYDAISGYKSVTKNSETDLMNALAMGPIAVSVDAAGPGWQFYKSGVYSAECLVSLDHGVVGVGYGHDNDGGDFWKIKNSWGTSWGEEGTSKAELTESNPQNDKMNPSMHCAELPLDEAVAGAVIGKILSFCSCKELSIIQRVNRKWKQLSQESEKQKLEIIISNLHASTNFNGAINTIWIIHNERSTLTEVERKLKYRFFILNDLPIEDMHPFIDYGSDLSDLLLIHDGIYDLPAWQTSAQINLIGIGANVVLNCDEDEFVYLDKLYAENISFVSDSIEMDLTEPRLIANIALIFVRCTFQQVSIFTQKNQDLTVENCTFLGGTYAICIDAFAGDVRIINSSFEGYGRESEQHQLGKGACISIEADEAEKFLRTDWKKLVSLKCIGNVFKNNFGFLVEEKHPPGGLHKINKFIIDTDRFELRDNVMEGFNAKEAIRFTRKEFKGANTIHHNHNPFVLLKQYEKWLNRN